MKRVHLVFKTHLDIGFTDLAASVVRRYLEEFIPRAMSLAEELDSGDGKPRFVWTTGSWLIWTYLREARPAERRRMESAIERGHIAWHALPFTTHSELLTGDLFSYGLTFSEELDRRFGRRTMAAKMSDVPGHTRAIVTRLARRGIRFLHIGVNTASKVPQVPPFFVWRSAEGEEIVVNYSRGYGAVASLPGLDELLVFVHASDNLGPPSRGEIEELYRTLGAQHPGGEITASTLDRFAEAVLSLRDRLPVVEEEIGDTWIHGAASDPKKVAELRELERLRDRWVASGELDPQGRECRELSESLLLVAEHTWGADLKTHLGDFVSYANEEFERARGARGFLFCEESWKEQRRYLERALASLAAPRAAEARRALDRLLPRRPDPTVGEEVAPGRELELGDFHVSLGEDGAIVGLVDGRGRAWASRESPIALFRYESFGASEVERWCREYLEITPQNHEWSLADFGKPGLEGALPAPVHERHRPLLASLRLQRSPERDRVIAVARLPEEAHRRYGAPRELTLVYDFPRAREEGGRIDFSLSWHDKRATRLPEASWLTFTPLVANPYRWSFTKLGERVSPFDVVRNGNRALHAIDGTACYRGADGEIDLTSLDAPLLAPGAPRILVFENSFADPAGGLHFLLHDNIWGTNFPQWYGEDALFRFSLTIRSNAPYA